MKRIGIGYENYKEFIDRKLYYVDKTLLIRSMRRAFWRAATLEA